MYCNQQPPLLLIPSEERYTWNLYNVLDNQFLDYQVRLPHKRFCGSSEGWLIAVERDLRVTLINPFRRVKGTDKKNSIIRLPALHVQEEIRESWVTKRKCNYYVYKAIMSADPILNAKDCIVTVIYEDCNQLAFMRPSKDATWTYVNPNLSRIQEILLVDQNKLYAIHNWDEEDFHKLSTFEISTQSSYTSNPKLVENYILSEDDYLWFKTYLLYSIERELLMISRYRICTGKGGPPDTRKFKIYKLDFDRWEWIEKETLGDIALFVGDNFPISVLASKFPGCMPNCIYFNHDHDEIGYGTDPLTDFGVYDVASQVVSQPYNTCAMTLVKMAKKPTIWVVPPFQAK
ncbi:F-box protein SKIP23-like [Rosa rugosa]|uniref:F-box protein SKIP23-like n=1 Tax=Rosa rugosa TaxID=74645 RepID=UPI002B401C91|nr:F-box protein SKIP23-like [Rosa rugosa]